MVRHHGVVVSKADDIGSLFPVEIDTVHLETIIGIILSFNAVTRTFFNFLRTAYLDYMAPSLHFSSQIVRIDLGAREIAGKKFMENIKDLHRNFRRYTLTP